MFSLKALRASIRSRALERPLRASERVAPWAEAAEARLLYSADAPVVAAAALGADALTATQGAPAAHPVEVAAEVHPAQQQSPRAVTLLVIDPRIASDGDAVRALVDQAQAGAALQVLVIQADQGGWSAVTEALQTGPVGEGPGSGPPDGQIEGRFASLQFLIAPGSAHLGASAFDLPSLREHALEVAAWGALLGPDADIRVGGLGEGPSTEGEALAEALRALTGAPVALAAAEPLAADGRPAAAADVGRTLLVVDAAHAAQVDTLSLLFGMGAHDQVLVLGADQIGTRQIADHLAAQGGFETIRIVSHGSDGGLRLGAQWLDTEALDRHADDLMAWRPHLAEDADLLFYACDLAQGEGGISLLTRMAELTGADVAASMDATGAQGLGGDWDLEFQLGPIQALDRVDPAAGEAFAGLLGVPVATTHVIVVTTLNDINDSGALIGYGHDADWLSTHKGSDGEISLREAIIAANNSSGSTGIHFALSGTGPHTFVLDSELPMITAEVHFDATTDGSFLANAGRPAVVLDGKGDWITGLTFLSGASGSSVRGFVFTNMSMGIVLNTGITGVSIQGNYFGAINPLGQAVSTRVDSFGILLNSGGHQIGGDQPGEGNVFVDVGSPMSAAIRINGETSDTNTIQGNRFGVHPDGTVAAHTGYHAIRIDGGADGTLIGGGTEGAGNWIARSQSSAIFIGTGSHDTRIEGNRIGTDLTGTQNWGAGGDGIQFQNGGGSNGTVIRRNVIAFSADHAILLDAGAGVDNLISQNSLYGSSTQGIGLRRDGVTLNDTGDADTGPNNRQNFPVLNAAVAVDAGHINVAGTLNSTPGSHFRIEFFQSPGAHATGYGEGRTYLGHVDVVTNGSGNASFDTTLAANLAAGPVITATAIRSADASYASLGDTSEFSAARELSNVLVVSTALDNNDSGITSQNADWLLANSGGPDQLISLREAIIAANNSSGPVIITFGIPGDGVHRISLSQPLPDIRNQVTLDASTDDSFAQNGQRPAVILDGNGLLTDGLTFDTGAAGSTVRGLVIQNFGKSGISVRIGAPDVVIAGNFIGAINADGSPASPTLGNDAMGIYVEATGVTIGGGHPGDRNVVSGNAGNQIAINTSAADARILGNYIGTDATGSIDADGLTPLTPGRSGIAVWGADRTTIGGTGAGERNVIAGNDYHGIALLDGTTNAVVQGNYIGLAADGVAALGNGGGICLWQIGGGNLIGGGLPGAGNVISGNVEHGIYAEGLGQAVIQGNLVGVSADGSVTVANGNHAFYLSTLSGYLIGSDGDGIDDAQEGNVIAAPGRTAIMLHDTDGVRVAGNLMGIDRSGAHNHPFDEGIHLRSNTRNTHIGDADPASANHILGARGNGITLGVDAGIGNSVIGNRILAGAMAIDLDNDGPTPNDGGDIDAGANTRQNTPELSFANALGGSGQVIGTLSSTPGSQFRLDFYAADTTGPGDTGLAQDWLGTVNVTTDASGLARFNVATAAFSAGRWVSATATRTDTGFSTLLSTSEMSVALAALPPTRPTSASITVGTDQDVARVFALADFPFTDVNGDALAGVRIETLPMSGGLTLAGVALSVGQTITATQIEAGALVYTPAAGTNDSTVSASNRQFEFRVMDETGLSALSTSLMGVSIPPIATVATITTSAGTTHYTENAAPVLVDADLVLVDAGLPDLVQATIWLSNSSYMLWQDVLAFTPVPHAGIVASWDDLLGVLTLSGAASTEDYQTALRGITYHNLSDHPSTAERTISFRVTDGMEDSNVATRALLVGAVNDAPSSQNTSANAAEDATMIAIELRGNDADSTLQSFRIVSLPAHGSLYADSLLTQPLALDDQVSALSNEAEVYFVPDADWHGTTSFTFAAVDTEDLEDATPATATITVSAVNDRPVIVSNGGGATAAISVPETTTSVTTVVATDVDGPAVSYVITGGSDAGLFQIDPTTGALSFRSAPDFEIPGDGDLNNVYHVTVAADDGSLTAAQALTITVTDVSAVLVVTTTADNNDSGIGVGGGRDAEWLNAHKGSDGEISLREALIAANNSSGPTVIRFAITGTGTHTISPATMLPAIVRPVMIDASSDDSFAANGNRPAIILDGGGVLPDGLRLEAGSDGSTIRGLSFQNFTDDGLEIHQSHHNTIVGNWFGVDASGAAAAGNRNGIMLWDSGDNQIGGSTAADRNVISGNTRTGITISGDDPGSISGNRITGNHIGMDVTGTVAVGSGMAGIWLGSAGTTVGGSATGEGNLISGVHGDPDINGDVPTGIFLHTTASHTRLMGNIVGLDVSGQSARPNRLGIVILSGDNVIGGTSAGARNVISANTGGGLRLNGPDAVNNVIIGNYIGTTIDGLSDPSGQVSTPEASGVIFALGASNNRLGSNGDGQDDLAERNIISGNNWFGVEILDSDSQLNMVQNNIIGLDRTGMNALGNSEGGVGFWSAAQNNRVLGNIISGNGYGVQLANGSSGNVIEGNIIGLGVDGESAVGTDGVTSLGNLTAGVRAYAGDPPEAVTGNVLRANTISNNQQGISFSDAQVHGNHVILNRIGTAIDGVTARGNIGAGVQIASGAHTNRIGGEGGSGSNLIAHNGGAGIRITGSASIGNAMMGNRIHSNGGLGIDLGGGGVTANDPGDADSGANHLQNFPVLTHASTDALAHVVVVGSLDSAAAGEYRIELFASDAADSSGHGEGPIFLGHVNVTTDAVGHASFSVTLNAVAPTASVITATATRAGGGFTSFTDTSEFSQGLVAVWQHILVVTTDLDTLDGDVSSVAALLTDRGADGQVSLREAITAINQSSVGTLPALIHFAIPGAGVHTISVTTALPVITETVIIDGRTDDSFSANGSRPAVVLDGNGLNASGLTLAAGADHSVVRGLAIQGFQLNGIDVAADRVTLVGNYIGRLDPLGGAAVLAAANGTQYGSGAGIRVSGEDVAIGTPYPGDGNVVSGNRGAQILIAASGARAQILGNFVGTDASGRIDIDGPGTTGLTGSGIVVEGAPDVVIGGAGGAGNLISGNDYFGIALSSGTQGARIQGNLIGTDVDGLVALGNGHGISLYQTGGGNLIGGSQAGDGNLIAGNAGNGLYLEQAVAGETIQGNRIGVTVDGLAALSNANTGIVLVHSSAVLIGTDGDGLADAAEGNQIVGGFGGTLLLSDADHLVIAGNRIGSDASGTMTLGMGPMIQITTGSTDNRIGGTRPGEGNLIRSNVHNGLDILGAGVRANSILGNRILTPNTHAIDLGVDGRTPNDPLDADAGPNDRQNTPVLGQATADGAGSRVHGTLSSAPDLYYRIEFFLSASGSHGDAGTWLGSLNVVTGSDGSVAFTAPVGAIPLGAWVTATATQSDDAFSTFGSTSELSLAVAAVAAATPVGSDRTLTHDEDTSVVIGRAQFSFSDPDGDAFIGVRIDALPVSGALRLDGVAVVLNQTISIVDIDAGRLSYVAAADANEVNTALADRQWRFTVLDSTGSYAASPNTMSQQITAVNDAPAITSDGGGGTAAVSVRENTAAVTTVTATDVDGPALSYSIVGGADAARFQIDALTGALSFITTPDFENPTDVGADNVYEVVVSAGDGSLSATQAIAVTVTDVSNILVVTTSADSNDSGIGVGAAYDAEWLNDHPGTDGEISLREALLAANNSSGPVMIRFAIPGTGVHTISVTTALPVITQTVIIDGRTDDSFAANGSRPAVVLDGTLGDGSRLSAHGLQLGAGAGHSEIRGLVIRNFDGSGIYVEEGADHVTIAGNYVGQLNADGTRGTTIRGNRDDGITLDSSWNIVGGTDEADRNVISGNDATGLRIGGDATHNRIEGNYIGTAADGLTMVSNVVFGILVQGSDTRIGGADPGARNLVAGNLGHQIAVSGTHDVVVAGNYIGLGADGMTDVNGDSNDGVAGHAGVYVTDSSQVVIGGLSAAERNVISGNGWYGVELHPGARDIRVVGNYLGTNALGTGAVGNSGGLALWNAGADIVIGGSEPGAGNLISGNRGNGVWASGGGVKIQGNLIGTTADGNQLLTNAWEPLNLSGAWAYVVGTDGDGIDDATEGNWIVHRGDSLAMTLNSGAHDNVVAGNRFGYFLDGRTTPLLEAVHLADGVHDNRIGGTGAYDGNRIGGITGTVFSVEGTARGNAFLGNIGVASFNGLALDLGRDGPTGNDTGDVDGGPNDTQNHPVITVATADPIHGRIIGSLNSEAARTYRIEVFGSDTPNLSGTGQPQYFIAAVEVTTDVSGYASFVLPSGTQVALGHFISATATQVEAMSSSFGSTSEFGPALAAIAPAVPTGADRTLSLDEDQPHVFIADDFGYADPNGDDLAGVRIESLPVSGLLTLSGAAVSVGQVVTAAQLGAGLFVYTPVADANNASLSPGSRQFDVRVEDATGSSALAANRMTLSIASVNDAPVITSHGGGATAAISVLEGGGAIGTVTATDVDADPILYSISGGVDAATFYIDDQTGALSFFLPPSFWSPTDDDGDNVYHVVVTASDGVLTTAQAIAVTVTAIPHVLVVTTDIDTNDSGIVEGSGQDVDWLIDHRGSDGKISLREALIAANNHHVPVTIRFAIPGSEVHTISVNSALPTITRTVILDANTDDSFVANGSRPAVILNGNGGSHPAFVFDGAGAANSVLRGFVIQNFGADAVVVNAGADRVRIVGNYIGRLDAAGNAAAASAANAGNGIVIGAQHVTVGGSNAGDRNVISGNGLNQIRVLTTGDQAVIEGNHIGTDLAGLVDVDGANILGYDHSGVVVSGAGSVRIGGVTALERNLISGNGYYGVEIVDGAHGTAVLGNYIGTDVTGRVALGNGHGLAMWNAGSGNFVGSAAPGAGNVIAGNLGLGVYIGGQDTSNRFQGNLVGLGADGETALVNAWGTIELSNVTDMVIGTEGDGVDDDSEGNVLVGEVGIRLTGPQTVANIIAGNSIGISVSGATVFGGLVGIRLYDGAHGNWIGGLSASDGNRIVGMSQAGIALSADAGRGNALLGNLVTGISMPIDLGEDGPDANDPDDADGGPNDGQNHPLLQTALAGGGGGIEGELRSEPNHRYRIEVFGTSGTSGLETLIGHVEVTTDALGFASFALPSGALQNGDRVSATATQMFPTGFGFVFGSTSEAGPGLEAVWWFEPTGTSSTLVTDENVAHVFSAADFRYSDPQGDPFIAVRIDTLPNSGALTLAGVAVSVGQRITVAQLAAGDLVYTPVADANDSTVAVADRRFDFSVQDGTYRYALNPATLTLSITPVNDPPTVTNVYAGAGEDIDRLAVTLAGQDFDGSVVRIRIDGLPAHGALYRDHDLTQAIAAGDEVDATGNAATVYFVPDADWHGTSTFEFRAIDDQDGLSAASATASISISPVNDAPVLVPGGPELAGIDEDALDPPGQTVASLIGGSITDADDGDPRGIAVIGQAGSMGHWQYSRDGGVSWQAMGVTSDSHALLLSDTDRVRFVPDGLHGSLASFDFRAWDRTEAGIDGWADARVNGGATAFSTGVDRALIHVAAVPDAPVLSTRPGEGRYLEGQAPIVVDPGLTVGDPDSTVLAGAAIRIAVGYAPDQDVLGFVEQNGITGHWDATTGTLRLSGLATVEAYQAALRSITYLNVSEHPSTAGRVLSIQVHDGALDSAPVLRAIRVEAVDGRPVVVTSPGGAQHQGAQNGTVVDAELTVWDGDSPLLTGATVRIAAHYDPTRDSLVFVDQNGITGHWDAQTGTLSLSGTASRLDYENALRSVVLQTGPDHLLTGSRVIAFSVRDASQASEESLRGVEWRDDTSPPSPPPSPVTPGGWDRPPDPTPVTEGPRMPATEPEATEPTRLSASAGEIPAGAGPGLGTPVSAAEARDAPAERFRQALHLEMQGLATRGWKVLELAPIRIDVFDPGPIGARDGPALQARFDTARLFEILRHGVAQTLEERAEAGQQFRVVERRLMPAQTGLFIGQDDVTRYHAVVGGMEAGGIMASVVVVAWLARAGSLLGAMWSTVPVWRTLDALALITPESGGDEDHDQRDDPRGRGAVEREAEQREESAFAHMLYQSAAEPTEAGTAVQVDADARATRPDHSASFTLPPQAS